MTNIKNELDVAIATHQQGKLEEAISLYTSLLKKSPQNPELLNLLGSALSQSQHWADAEEYLHKSVALAPEEEGYWVNYAQHLARQKKWQEAIELLTKNVSASSAYLPVWQTLFKAALASQQEGLAAEYLQKALLIEYSFKTLMSLSQLLVRQERHGEAAELLNSYKKQAADEPSYWHALCWLYDFIGHWGKLSETALQWGSSFKHDKNAYRFLASSYFQMGRQHDAITVYEGLLSRHEKETSDADELLQDKARYIELCVASVELEKANNVLNTIAQKEALPGLINAQVQLAIFKGDGVKAESLCNLCVEKYPEFLSIYSHLSRVAPKSLSRPQYQMLQNAIDSGSNISDSLAFVLAHYHHANEEFESAFEWYQKANQLRAEQNKMKGAQYSEEEATHFLDDVVSISKQIKEKYGPVSARHKLTHSPIFIVGMPRSGTTLLEGMLASHKDINKTGERIEFPNLLRSLVNGDIAQENVKDVLEKFISEYTGQQTVGETARFFIDKNPSNYMAIGLITTLFPNSLIIDIERDPIETALSIYRHEFSHLWSYATSLDDIAHQYKQYKKFIGAWGEKTNNVIHVKYEELVENPEEHIKSLLALLGLNSKGLDIEKGLNEQDFTTFSALQVRDKISNFNGVADRYMPFLTAYPKVLALK